MLGGSPEELADAAREADSSGIWRSYISPQEHSFMIAALAGGARTWAAFIEGKLPCQTRSIPRDEADEQYHNVDSTRVVWHVRFMLWERALFWHSGSSESTTDAASQEQHQHERAELSKPLGKSRGEDDEYDDDDDDSMGENAAGDSTEEPAQDVPDFLTVDLLESGDSPDSLGQSQTLASYNKIYHTFDRDRELLSEQYALETGNPNSHSNDGNSGSSVSEGSDETGDSGSRLSSDYTRNGLKLGGQFGAANLSLKHLLAIIEQRRDETKITDIELRNLISDVRKNRSKWASEDRIGQEELYEAAEKVVLELRAYTEHSTAFLNKVNKREAPGYYQIIKEPMDLNTVMRKLRALQYNSKEDFVSDLDLIWDNCLTYNSDPKHFLRAHAIAMRKKTEALAPLIPDVRVRRRSEVERETKAQAAAAATAAASRGAASKSLKRKIHSIESDSESESVAPRSPSESVTDRNASDEPSEGQNDLNSQSNESTREGDRQISELPESSESLVLSREASAPASAVPGAETSVEPSVEPSDEQSEEQHKDPENKDISSDSKVKLEQLNDEGSSKLEVDSTRHSDEENDDDDDDAMDVDTDGEIDSLESSAQSEVPSQDVEDMVWQANTNRLRVAYLSRRKAIFLDNKLQPDAAVFIRTAAGMARFTAAMKSAIAPELVLPSALSKDLSRPSESICEKQDMSGQDGASNSMPIPSTNNSSKSSGEEKPFLDEYEIMSGVPVAPADDPKFYMPLTPAGGEKTLPPSRYAATGLVKKAIDRNLNEMQDIRRLCSKILLIRDMQQNPGQAALAVGQTMQDYPFIAESEPEISSRLPGALPIWGPAARAGMRRVAATLAMNTGFESAQRHAVDILAEVGGDFMLKLAGILVANLEDPKSTASVSALVKGTLQQMGIPKLDTLARHISDDVFKQTFRLTEFRQRLSASLGELLRPEIERYKDEQFKDNSDQFVLGQFSNELGDDYFGFKELGLDHELGVANIAIPFHLLQQRLANEATSAVGSSPTSRTNGASIPEYPSITASALPNIIGLLRPAFAQYIQNAPKPAPKTKTAVSGPQNNDVTGSHTNLVLDTADTSRLDQSPDATASLTAPDIAQWSKPKVPASGKLIPRKHHIDKAYVIHKPVDPAPVFIEDNQEPHDQGNSLLNGVSLADHLDNEEVGNLMLATDLSEQDQLQSREIDSALDELDAFDTFMQ